VDYCYGSSTRSEVSGEVLSSLQPLRCRDLASRFHSDRSVNAVVFSDDDSFFVSGGEDGRVLLWPTSKAIDDYGANGIEFHCEYCH